jgi:hypothetical protein
MAKLEGVTRLRGKIIVLEDLENPILKRVLHMRLRGDNFNFWYHDSAGHQEHKDSPDPWDDSRGRREHHDNHKDNHTESHRDHHTDRLGSYLDDGSYSDHTDRGYSEHTNYGYSEHTDGYIR